MLKLNKELERISGGTIPSGSIIIYKIVTTELTEEVTIMFNIFGDKQKLQEGKPLPNNDIVQLIIEGTPVSGGKYTPSSDVLEDLPENPKLVNVTDEIVKTFLEEAFFGPNCITKLGTELPD